MNLLPPIFCQGSGWESDAAHGVCDDITLVEHSERWMTGRVLYRLMSRIRRRRAGGVDDTTDAIRAPCLHPICSATGRGQSYAGSQDCVVSRLRDGQSMNARMNGRISAPNGMIIRHESQGDNPAFLQMNQNGSTPTSAKTAPRSRMIMISGVPRGPIEASNRLWVFIRGTFFCLTVQRASRS